MNYVIAERNMGDFGKLPKARQHSIQFFHLLGFFVPKRMFHLFPLLYPEWNFFSPHQVSFNSYLGLAVFLKHNKQNKDKDKDMDKNKDIESWEQFSDNSDFCDTVDHSWQIAKLESWHWGLVIDNQRVTWTAFAILAMFTDVNVIDVDDG